MAKLHRCVTVQRCGRDLEHELSPPVSGVVVRQLMRDDSFWVALDARQREEVHPFPADDETRATHVLTWDEGCATEGRMSVMPNDPTLCDLCGGPVDESECPMAARCRCGALATQGNLVAESPPNSRVTPEGQHYGVASCREVIRAMLQELLP